MRKHLRNYFIPHEHNDYKPHSVRTLSLLTILAVATVATLATIVATTNTVHNQNLAAVHAAYLTQLTSDERVERKLAALTEDPLLVTAAKLKAKDMLEKEYFAHVSPDGKQPWDWITQAGYQYEYAGENLAIDFYDTRKVNSAWMDSPTHRANILNNHYEDVGIAVETGTYEGRRVTFVVQMFGKKKAGTPLVATPIVATAEEEPEITAEEVATEQVLGETTEEHLAVETPTPSETPEPVVVEQETETQVETQEEILEKAPYRATHAGSIGKIIILLAVGLLTLSLLLKTFIEMQRQHYRQMFFALGALLLVAVLYIVLTLFTGQVTIL